MERERVGRALRAGVQNSHQRGLCGRTSLSVITGGHRSVHHGLAESLLGKEVCRRSGVRNAGM